MEPGQDVVSLQRAVLQLKEAVELLTGQRGANEYSLIDGLVQLQKANGTSSGRILELNEVVLGGETSLVQRTTILESTVDENVAQLTTVQQAVDGISVRYGVTGSINGITGGFVFEGIQMLDGSVVYDFEINSNVTINGDVIINGSITASDKVEALSVTNPVIGNAAVSQTVYSSGGSPAVSVSARAGAKVLLTAVYTVGTFSSGSGANGNLFLTVGGVDITSTNIGKDTITAGGVSTTINTNPLPTVLQHVYDIPSDGSYTFGSYHDWPGGPGVIILTAVELSK
jgi:hypothetical protein